MKIKDVTTREVSTCAPESSLAHAASQMWDKDCGAIPVVNDGHVVGMITDRDIAIATSTRSRQASHIAVREVIREDLHSCHPEDDPKAALETMAREKVRRLPVVDEEDRLQGMVSINDFILKSQSTTQGNRSGSDLSIEEVIGTLKEISRHPREARGENPQKAGARITGSY